MERSAHEPFQQGCRVRHVHPRRVVRGDSREGAHCSGRENVFHVSSGNMSPFYKVRSSPTASVRTPQVWKTDDTHPSQQSIRNAVMERKKKGARWDGKAGTQKSGLKNKVNRPLSVVCSLRQRRRAAGRRRRPGPEQPALYHHCRIVNCQPTHDFTFGAFRLPVHVAFRGRP